MKTKTKLLMGSTLKGWKCQETKMLTSSWCRCFLFSLTCGLPPHSVIHYLCPPPPKGPQKTSSQSPPFLFTFRSYTRFTRSCKEIYREAPWTLYPLPCLMLTSCTTTTITKPRTWHKYKVQSYQIALHYRVWNTWAYLSVYTYRSMQFHHIA